MHFCFYLISWPTQFFIKSIKSYRSTIPVFLSSSRTNFHLILPSSLISPCDKLPHLPLISPSKSGPIRSRNCSAAEPTSDAGPFCSSSSAALNFTSLPGKRHLQFRDFHLVSLSRESHPMHGGACCIHRSWIEEARRDYRETALHYTTSMPRYEERDGLHHHTPTPRRENSLLDHLPFSPFLLRITASSSSSPSPHPRNHHLESHSQLSPTLSTHGAITQSSPLRPRNRPEEINTSLNEPWL